MPEPAPQLPEGISEDTVYRALFSAYPDTLLVVDGQGRIVMGSPAATALLGYPLAELLGMSVDALVPDAGRSGHAACRDGYAKAPAARRMGTSTDVMLRRKDGAEVLVEIALSPLRDHGRPLVIAAVRGIGTYPRVQQALRRARYSECLAQLGRLAADTREPRALLEQAPPLVAEALNTPIALVSLLEPDGQTLRLVSGVGLMPHEKPGALQPLRVDRPSLLDPLLRGEVLVVDDYRSDPRFTVPDAYLQAGIVSGIAVPLFDRGRVLGIVGVRTREHRVFGDDERQFLISLSSLLSTSLQRAQTEEALSHSQRMETVGQLTGGIAHDFNNLLTVIQGNLQMLRDLPLVDAQPAAAQMVDAAARASRRAADLTAKLLVFARRQVLQPTTLSPGALLRSLADMLNRTLEQRIRIEVDVAASCPNVLADPVQLEAALLNIAINARDAMPAGGLLRLCVAPTIALPPAARRQIEDPSAPDQHFVHFSISDTGVGMTQDIRERVFEPFFTTKEAGRGTGLGLSTVYGFVRQSGGAITIDTAPGVGTTVSLFIPRPFEPGAAAALQDGDQTMPAAGLKILVVEDDEEVRRVVLQFLSTLARPAVSAESAEQALVILEEEGPFDLLLTDIALGPGMRGTKLASIAQRAYPGLAILLMSGFSAEMLGSGDGSGPAWELLHKPFSRGELARAIDRVMKRQAP